MAAILQIYTEEPLCQFHCFKGNLSQLCYQEILCVGNGNDTGLLRLSEIFPALRETLTFL